jgi:pimeloyl-ACP methyl ester carboxylesterase
VSPPRLQPLRLGPDEGRLSAVFTDAAAPRAAVLMLAPFPHEWQRSYRLFALLSNALAERGIAGLRFDYRGCGDSAGDDAEFCLSQALRDAHAALDWLQTRVQAPVHVLAIRAGALIGGQLCAATGLTLLAWQPVENGAAYLQALQQRDQAELNNRRRFPFQRLQRASAADELLGSRLHPALCAELAAARLTHPVALRIDTGTADIELGPALANWVDEIDLATSFPLPQIRALAARLAERLEAQA